MRTADKTTTTAAPTRETMTTLVRAAKAFAAMDAAVRKVEENLAEFDTFWLAQYATQTHTHYVQGQAYATAARDLGAGEDLLRLATAGDVSGLEAALGG